MKKIFFSLILLILIAGTAKSQIRYQPYSYQFYQKLNDSVYSPSTELHTSIKPFLIADSSVLRHSYDSLMNRGVNPKYKAWFWRKVFNEHVFDVKEPDYTFFFDYLPDLTIGREFHDQKTTWLNTRGFQAGGTIGKRFFFYTSAYENQGKFANYEDTYINKVGIVPGQAFDFTSGKSTKDWAYVSALLGYSVSKSVMIETGVDKTFIGDGYRSMLLSDYAQSYPLLRLRLNLGKKVQYMFMWSYMQDQDAPKFGPANLHPPHRIKWTAFHYIDWNITKRASLGFFNALVAPDAYDNGETHGFDINYVNPILFVKSLAPKGPIPDNTLIGFNGKYKVFNKTTVYGQILFDQSATAENTKNSYQLGFRGADLFKVKGFNYLFEYNTAKPYTYSHASPLVNYEHFDEPLAHPFGANFKEVLGILNYSIGKFDLQGQINYAKYGLNMNGLNYGKDILIADENSQGDKTGQGLSTTLKYAEGRVSYLINPKYNLRLESGLILRQETNSSTNTKTGLITFGLRSTFRNLYTDF
jgi:hypothetical protein